MSVSHEYITSYRSKPDILNFIKTPEFFFKMTEALGNNEYVYKPDITLKKNLFLRKYVKWPQSISYTGVPELPISIPSILLTETYINSTFNLVYDELYCDFNTNVNNMVVNISFKLTFCQEGEFQKVTIECTNPDELFIPNFLIKAIISNCNDVFKKVFG
tara:strand:- start:203 stop:682 length:480 start_codon:yes stop_codon:yes gene_type:complete